MDYGASQESGDSLATRLGVKIGESQEEVDMEENAEDNVRRCGRLIDKKKTPKLKN